MRYRDMGAGSPLGRKGTAGTPHRAPHRAGLPGGGYRRTDFLSGAAARMRSALRAQLREDFRELVNERVGEDAKRPGTRGAHWGALGRVQ